MVGVGKAIYIYEEYTDLFDMLVNEAGGMSKAVNMLLEKERSARGLQKTIVPKRPRGRKGSAKAVPKPTQVVADSYTAMRQAILNQLGKKENELTDSELINLNIQLQEYFNS